jgi:hypothetical protein
MARLAEFAKKKEENAKTQAEITQALIVHKEAEILRARSILCLFTAIATPLRMFHERLTCMLQMQFRIYLRR